VVTRSNYGPPTPLPLVPPPGQTPPETEVARVGAQVIGEREFRRWLRVALHGVDRRTRPGSPGYRALRRQVMHFLIQGLWIRQEAQAVGVSVTDARVRRAFEREKRASFPGKRAYRRFLRRSGMTERDLLYRVKLDILQARVTRHAAASAPPVTQEDVSRYYSNHRHRYHGVPAAKARRAIRRRIGTVREMRALSRFIEDFRHRYRAITVCADGYVVSECARGRHLV
jgi:hypothetical protein